MALVRCRKCGNEVATDAAACPDCGMSTSKMVALVLGGLGLLCVGSCFLSGLVAAIKAGSTSTGSGPSVAARTVDMRTLLRDYSDNGVRADASYKDVFVQTSGIVGDVKKDMIGGAYIVLGSGEFLEMPWVQCTLDKAQEKKAAFLSKDA